MKRSRDRSSERGSVLIIVALSSVALLGIAAFSVDASFSYDLRNKLGAAADAAAKSAAFEVKRGNAANLVTFAQAEVDRHATDGLIPSGVTMDAHLCTAVGATCSAPYVGTGYVEVILTKTQPTFFGPIMGFMNLEPKARAVAGTAAPDACFTSMNDLSLGKATITGTGCTVRVGGDLIGTNPNAEIIGPTLVTGDCLQYCGNYHTYATDQPVPENPFADLVPLTPTTPCGPAPAGVSPIPAGCYTTIPNQATITFGAGVTFVSGTWDLANNNKIYATSGSLIYLLSTGKMIGLQAEIHITASDTIAGYEGIALAGDAGSSMVFNNGLVLDITGAAALANTTFESKNNITIANTTCNIMVFNDFETNNGTGEVSGEGCAALFSGAKYLSVALAE
jgi:hypothetical protein